MFRVMFRVIYYVWSYLAPLRQVIFSHHCYPKSCDDGRARKMLIKGTRTLLYMARLPTAPSEVQTWPLPLRT